jgi:preprotein translocase subunit SecF
MEFFRIKKDIPFMRHALALNAISLITFLAAVFFLWHNGLHLSIEFTGGTVMEVSYPQTAIAVGFDKAWATILDSNVTTLIAGLALLAFGSGPIKGFAVVHCLGILTSMFSAVFFSRGLVNLWYGRGKKVQKLAIGQVWRPQEK